MHMPCFKHPSASIEDGVTAVEWLFEHRVHVSGSTKVDFEKAGLGPTEVKMR